MGECDEQNIFLKKGLLLAKNKSHAGVSGGVTSKGEGVDISNNVGKLRQPLLY